MAYGQNDGVPGPRKSGFSHGDYPVVGARQSGDDAAQAKAPSAGEDADVDPRGYRGRGPCQAAGHTSSQEGRQRPSVRQVTSAVAVGDGRSHQDQTQYSRVPPSFEQSQCDQSAQTMADQVDALPWGVGDKTVEEVCIPLDILAPGGIGKAVDGEAFLRQPILVRLEDKAVHPQPVYQDGGFSGLVNGLGHAGVLAALAGCCFLSIRGNMAPLPYGTVWKR